MGLGVGRKGKTGAYATGADILELLALEGQPLPAKVLDWRQLAKLKTHLRRCADRPDRPANGPRPHLLSAGRGVDRPAVVVRSEPAEHPRPHRGGTEDPQCLRRPAGHVLLSADYSQIELRLLAHVADIGQLKDAFRDGHDIHAMTASQVFGVPIEGMDPFVRRKAKAINFGIIYGISAFGLARQLGIGRGEAGAYIDAYFARYPGIRDYMERTKRDARTKGFVTTLFGRRCHTQGDRRQEPGGARRLPNGRRSTRRSRAAPPISSSGR